MANNQDEEWEARSAYPSWVRIVAVVAIVALLGFAVSQIL